MKKLITILLALVLILSLAACGSGDNTDNSLKVTKSVADLKGKDYKDVKTLLQVAGFTNIEVEVLDDLILGWLKKDGEVEKVSINGDTDFSANSKYPHDAKIVITYHTFPSTETEKVPKTKETTKAREASGVSGDRNVSGFDTKTNQTITWCGIEFSFPSYFNVLNKRSTETSLDYYPEEKEYYASLVFQSEEFSGTQEYFNKKISSIVESTVNSDYFANTELQKSEGITIAGLPGWTITYSESDTDGDGVTSKGSYSFAYNINTGKIVMISCSYDSNDQSQYDYLGDYKKVLETARIEKAPSAPSTLTPKNNKFDPTYGGKFRVINVDGGDTSGDRASMVVVDVGFGERKYWAYTNEYGQLVRVIAAKIVIQDSKNEPVNADGRYYDDEAKISGTERADLDEGHVIADSLGGVSNAYNITPQDSVMNRHGDQAYMEKVIRDAGGCTDFEAIITYSNTKTQIPSHYKYTYTIKGNVIVDSFDNINPDVANQAINKPATKKTSTSKATQEQSPSVKEDISAIDTNGNGKVTIAEAKAAGFKMPIKREHWLYKYMDDRDGDGMVGE